MTLWRTIGWFTLALGVHTSAFAATKLVDIPNTDWTIDSEDNWSQNDIEALEALAPLLPKTYRHPGVPVFIRLGETPSMRGDRAHVLAKIHRHRPTITLFIRGLADRLTVTSNELQLDKQDNAPQAAARQMVQRALIHELTHLVDRRYRHSKHIDWRKLSGWNRRGAALMNRMDATAGEFASPWGAQSPAEDLATFAEVFFLPPTLGLFDAEKAPKCRFPTKYRYMQRRFPTTSARTQKIVCSGPGDVGLHPDLVGEIQILLGTPSFKKVASIGGHIAVAIEILDQDPPRWETFTLVADEDQMDTNSLELIVLGLFGGFTSRVKRESFEATRVRYTQGEGRDVLRYQLHLSDAEKRLFLERLDDIYLHWRRPYFYLRRNCGALIVELMNAVDPAPFPTPKIASPDLILAELGHRGRITAIPPAPERTLSAGTRARMTLKERDRSKRELCGDVKSGLRSWRLRRRERAMLSALKEARRLNTEECWRKLSKFHALSIPFERALLSRSDSPETPNTSDEEQNARGKLREAIPMHMRLAAHTQVNEWVGEEYARQQPRGTASRFTPYSPTTIGYMTMMGPANATHMIFVRRAIIDLAKGQPRLFPLARGVNFRLMDTSIGVSTSLSPDFYSNFQFFALAYHPDHLLPGPNPGYRVKLLGSHGSTIDDQIWMRWVEGAAGLNIVRSPTNSATIDLWIGADIRNEFRFKKNSLKTTTWLFSPAEISGTIFTDGWIQVGLTSSITGSPGVNDEGYLAFMTRGRSYLSVFLGRLGRAALKLTVNGEATLSQHGRLEPQSDIIQVGFRVDPR